MNERLISLAGACAALAIVFILLVPHRSSDADRLSLPTSEDRGRDGLHGLKRWLDEAGIRTLTLRRRYNTLADGPSMPDTGNLLITSLPHRRVARDWERQFLIDWLRTGNSILVLAAVEDSPPWSRFNAGPLAGRGARSTKVLNDLGFAFTPGKPRSSSSSASPDPPPTGRDAGLRRSTRRETRAWRRLRPQGPHAVLQGVDGVAVSGFSFPRTWRLEPDQRYRALFVLLRHEENGDPGLWQARIGQGTAWISAYADLFGNVSLGQSDNARLLANLVHASLARDGVVLFDDIHQGLSDLYDPDAFYKDPRVHHTIWFLVALWGLYVVGRSNRLAPLRPRQDPPKAVDFTRAVGGLLARRVSPASIASGLLSSFFNDIRAGHGLPTNGEPVWDILSRSSKLSRRALAALQAAHGGLPRTRRADLVRLTNLIRHIRMELT